jgi:hypothetical protein
VDVSRRRFGWASLPDGAKIRQMSPPAAPRRSVEADPPSLRATTSIPPPPARARSGARRWLAGGLVGALVVTGLVLGGSQHAKNHTEAEHAVVVPSPTPSATLDPDPAPTPAPAATAIRADAALDREGHTLCAGGTLVVLPDFTSADGKFDLVIHAHGASDLVAQSAATTKLDGVIVAFSLGVGSGVYDAFFGWKPRFGIIVEQAEAVMEKRGLHGAKVRRIALGAFSAGFGGVERMLEQPGAIERVDSVLLYDALHAGYDEHHEIDFRRIEAVTTFAGLAVRGEKLFFATHSDIGTFEYASTHATADALLASFGVARRPGGDTPASIALPALGGEAGYKLEHPLEPLSVAEKGGLTVRGFAGDKAEDHLAHLHQMATTGFPKLAERWRTPPR